MATDWDLGSPHSAEMLETAYEAFPLSAERLASSGKHEPNRKDVFPQGVPMSELFESLSGPAAALLQLACYHDGVTRQVVIAESPDVDPADIDRAARELVASEYASVDGKAFRIRPDLDEIMSPPFPLFRLALKGITSDRLATACKLWGVDGGTTKAGRAAALAQILRDPVRLREGLASTVPGTAEVLDRVIQLSTSGFGFVGERDAPRGAISVYDLVDEDPKDPMAGYRALAALRPANSRAYGRQQYVDRGPLDELTDRLILGSHQWGDAVWPWLDVLVALGRVEVAPWPVAPAAQPAEIDTSSRAAATTVAALLELVEHLGRHPPEGKKSGDRRPPVKTWRTAAKAIGIDTALAEVLGDAAVDVGLIYAAQMPVRGRGRSAEHPVSWRPNPLRVEEFAARTTGQNWLAVLDSWVGGAGSSDCSSIRRRLLLSVLGSLPEGTGLGRADFGRVAAHRHTGISGSVDVDEMLRDLVALGAVAAGGIVGLTAAGRAAATGAEAIDAVVGGTETSFVVQPDHSVIAPGDLAPAVAAQLRRYADLESEGGATVWRLARSRLARASSAVDVDEVVDFFARHSSVPLPDVVERFISDSMSGASPVSVETVGCVVTCADPIALADASRYKAAKLTVLAPGVATSSLPATKVVEVLARQGVVLSGGEAPETVKRDADFARRYGRPAPAPTDVIDSAWGVQQPDPNRPLRLPHTVGLTGEQRSALVDKRARGAT